MTAISAIVCTGFFPDVDAAQTKAILKGMCHALERRFSEQFTTEHLEQTAPPADGATEWARASALRIPLLISTNLDPIVVRQFLALFEGVPMHLRVSATALSFLHPAAVDSSSVCVDFVRVSAGASWTDEEINALFAALCSAAATSTSAGSPRDASVTTLRAYLPLVVTSNVRRFVPSGVALYETMRKRSPKTGSSDDTTIEAWQLRAPAAEALGQVRVLLHSVASTNGETSRRNGYEGDIVVGVVHPPLPKKDGAPQAVFHVMDSAGQLLVFSGPTRVLAALGTRESSTHVNGGVPTNGIPIDGPTEACWIAGDSGLVGIMLGEGGVANPLAERGQRFTIESLVCRPDSLLPSGESNAHSVPLTVTDLAICRGIVADSAAVRNFSTPIVVIGGTSAEAGKSTLTKKIVGFLATAGMRVAAIKATGTGGMVDSQTHAAGGALLTLDQVDCGIPTSYIPAPRFAGCIHRAFCACELWGAGVIVVELGGDLLWANNLTLLKLNFFRSNLATALVIANDPFAAYGVAHWWNAEVFSSEATESAAGASQEASARYPRLSLVASPFRSVVGATRRHAALGLPLPWDCNDVAGMGAHVVREVARLRTTIEPTK